MEYRTAQDYLNAAWSQTEQVRMTGFPRVKAPQQVVLLPPLSRLRETQWNKEFEQLMRNRMIMGAFRYGVLEGQRATNYDYIGNVRARLNAYEQTGNTEHLVDAANLSMIAFVHDRHANKHFAAHDDLADTHCKPKGE